jgi:hypothetical protein
MPRKKIYDVKPPKSHKKKENPIKEYLDEKPKKSAPVAAAPIVTVKSPKKKEASGMSMPSETSRKVWLWALLALVVIGAGTYLFFALQRVNVTLWPAVDTLSFQETVTANQSASAVDATNLVVPAKTLTDQKSESEDFPATGNANNQGQASGTITVYNKISPSAPLTLKAGTHFLSDGGKLFVASKGFTVPAATSKGPGSVQVAVQATSGGTDYNIAASNFSIPGLKGTSYYYSVYGTSTAAMTGGYSGSVKEVTADDIQTAQNTLQARLTADAIADLKTKVPAGYILLDDAVASNVTLSPNQVTAGTVEQTFTLQGSAAITAVIFKKADLDQLAGAYVTSQLQDGQAVLSSTLKEDYTVSSLDATDGKVALSVALSEGAYHDVDVNALSLAILGQNQTQINQTITTMLGDAIQKRQINFWPFWTTKVPNNQSDVHIYLKFN